MKSEEEVRAELTNINRTIADLDDKYKEASPESDMRPHYQGLLDIYTQKRGVLQWVLCDKKPSSVNKV